MSLPALGIQERARGRGTLENVFPAPPLTLPHSPGFSLKGLLLTPQAFRQPSRFGSPRHRREDLKMPILQAP